MILIIAMTAVLSVSSYYVYASYIEHEDTKESIKSTNFTILMEKIFDEVDKEIFYSATYIATKESTAYVKLKEARLEVDTALAEVYKFSNRHHSFKIYQERFSFISDNFKYARTRVDALSLDYKNIFFELYHAEILVSLLETMEMIAKKETSPEIRTSLKTYIDFAKLRENIELESAYITFMLRSAKKMETQDLILWDTILLKDIRPSFDELKNIKLLDRLNALMTPEEYDEISSDVRTSILYNSLTGLYTTTLAEWNTQLEKKRGYIDTVQNILIFDIKSEISNSLSTSKNILIIYLVVAIMSLMILLALLVAYYNNTREKQLLEDTLKKIEEVLSLQKQKELKVLIENREINGIYKFLIDTIREANETKDLFLANMSHEIRTPLNGIVGFTQLLKSTIVTEEQKEFITIIENSSDNLLTIVNDILDFSKIKADKIDLEYIEFDPLKKFESAVETYAAKAAEKNIDFNIFVDSSLPTVMIGDPSKVSQIIVNLISNAIKFTSEKGTVDVLIEKVEENEEHVSVSFSVVDTGTGISEEQQKKIFEAFSQADVSTSRKFGGTGLGLAISAKLVGFMGGKLNVKSKEGEGSIFYFSLQFDKGITFSKRVNPNMEKLKVGLIIPDLNINIKTNSILSYYIECTGAKYKFYTKDELLELEKDSLPDVIFIDHKYHRDLGKLNKILSINTKVIFMIEGNKKKSIESIEKQIDRILYKPITLTKTMKSLEIAYANSTSKVEEKNNDIVFFNKTALVAEDNIINQKLIKRILQGFGINVKLANNGKEALNFYKNNSYDIIFMDIQMPIMGGIDATREILEYEISENKQHVPIVALTANTLTGDREKYIKAGMDNYLPKPLEFEKLSLLLQEYFTEKPSESEDEQDKDIFKFRKEIYSISESKEIKNNLKKEINTVILPRIREKKDILFHHSSALVERIYSAKLIKLGYKIDTTIDSQKFMDLLDKIQYSSVIYDADVFLDGKCMIADIIRDYGAKPFMIMSSSIEKDTLCCDMINMKSNIEDFKNILKENVKKTV